MFQEMVIMLQHNRHAFNNARLVVANVAAQHGGGNQLLETAMNPPTCTTTTVRKLSRATAIAIEAHHGQRRKDGSPALLHPLAVVAELIDAGVTDADTLASAILHDLLEDSPEAHEMWLKRIGYELGPQVANWVQLLTDDMRLDTQVRKTVQLAKYRDAPPAVRMIKLADRLTNLISLPPQWDSARTQAYAHHSHQLLALLAGTHSILEARLRSRLSLLSLGVPIEPLAPG